jgi:hypothetical protein
MDEAEWERLGTRLWRLLSVEERVFHETSTDAPVATWLVLRIDTIGGIRKTRNEARARLLGEVFESVALLYERALLSKAKVAFWTRVVTSPMMRDRKWASNRTIPRYTRLLAETPVCLLLDWSHMGMSVSDITSVLERSLFQQARRSPYVQKLTLGLRLSGCRVTQGGLETLDQAWAKHRDEPVETRMLVATEHMGRLDLSGLNLSRNGVDELVRLLRHHHVWDLRLDEDTLARIAHLPSIGAIVSSALSSPSLSPSTEQRPIHLSFSHNTLTVDQLKTIANALATDNTRPVARLSLAKSLSAGDRGGPDSTWWWLARIMLRLESSVSNEEVNPSDAITELDLSETVISDLDLRTFRDSLGAMVLEQLSEGDVANLWCKIKPPPVMRSTIQPISPTIVLDAAAEYLVSDLHMGDRVQISRSDDGPVWVPVEAIASFRCGDQTLRLCPRFNSLILNNARVAPPWGTTVADLIAIVGTSLRRIAARCSSANFLLPRVAEVCSHLTHLDLDGPSVLYQLSTVQGLPGLPCLQQFTYHISMQMDFRAVERFVDERPTIQVIEIIHSSHLRGDQPFAQRCEQFVADHGGRELEAIEPIAISQKAAFLSVPIVGHVASPLVAIVWAFAASRVRRRVLWHCAATH